MRNANYDPIVYIGRYASDIEHTDFFFGSIVAHGVTNSPEHNFSYCDDHSRLTSTNEDRLEKSHYAADVMTRFRQENPAVRFMIFAQNCFEELLPGFDRSEFICLNDMCVNNLLDSKVFVRQWLSAYCNVLPYTITTIADSQYERLVARFNGLEDILIQNDRGRGGYGTWIVHCDEDYQAFLQSNMARGSGFHMMMATPFLEKSKHISQQIIIFDSNILLLQPSIEILEYDGQRIKYRGGDFGAYADDFLRTSFDKILRERTERIGEAIQRTGYRGIAGIDYLLDADNMYFVEINPRFLGSSPFLSRSLVANGLPSLYELNYLAFTKQELDDEIARHVTTHSIRTRFEYKYIIPDGDLPRLAVIDGAAKKYNYVSDSARLYVQVSN